MLIGKVIGNIVSSNKAECLKGLKLLLVQPVDLETMKTKDDPIVMVDCVDAGTGDIVMCVGGSSARATPESKDTPADYAILSIVDAIHLKGSCIFQKSGDLPPQKEEV